MDESLLHIEKQVDFSTEADFGFFGISLIYAKTYERSPKTFLKLFIESLGVKMNCAGVVQAYKHSGAFDECKQSGKDFSDYANKQLIEDKWKRVLAEVLLVLYSIIHTN